MLKKLKMEADTYGVVQKTILWIALGVIISWSYYHAFVEQYPDGGDAELLIWVLTNHHYILLLLPILLLAFTSARAGEARRYPVLLRCGTRIKAQEARLGARGLFALFMVLSQMLMLFVAGSGLPARGNLFPQAENVDGIIVCQCLNIVCYLMFMLLLREIFQNLFRNTALELFFTMLIPIFTRGAVLAQNTKMVLISPWGSIAYSMAYNLPEFHTVNELGIIVEIERSDYRFYWQYWLAVLVVSAVVAVLLERNRDYVFEQNRRSM